MTAAFRQNRRHSQAGLCYVRDVACGNRRLFGKVEKRYYKIDDYLGKMEKGAIK